MSYPALQPDVELQEPAAPVTVIDSQEWPFSHLHFDRSTRTWIGHVDEASLPSPHGDDPTSPQPRCA